MRRPVRESMRSTNEEPRTFALEPQPIPVVLRGGNRFLASLGTQGVYHHRMGGICRHRVEGNSTGNPNLHLLVTLDANDPKLELPSSLGELPLLYGFTYDGCELAYTVLPNGVVRVDRLMPNRPSDDWPYPDYPAALPEIPFDLDAGAAISGTDASGVTWQGIEEPWADFAVIVPPSPTYGVSLWGPEGDSERVLVVFSIVTSTLQVSARNQCT